MNVIAMVNNPKEIREAWEKEFDEIGFGNQARIVGAKRVELKDFLRKTIESEKQKAVRETEKAYGGCKNCYGKGYSTYRHGVSVSSDFPEDKPITRTERGFEVTMIMCICDRGKQLDLLLSPKTEQEDTGK